MSSKARGIKVGLLGLGVIGSRVAQELIERTSIITTQLGSSIEISAVLVRDLEKQRSVLGLSHLITASPGDIIDNPDIDVVVEVMGGEMPALDFVTRAIDNGKHIVTANKELISKHGSDLMLRANQNKVCINFEASVGGGIPIIRPIMEDLRGNDLRAIRSIINGTTNYILSQMTQRGIGLDQALSEAQDLGYAEPDPTNDVEGIDSAYKLSILASLAFQTQVRDIDVYREGISSLNPKDIRYAGQLGYRIKLMAIAKKEGDRIEARVHPALIPESAPLAKVEGVFNAVEIEGDLVGRVLFHGQGAGPMPTSSAILGDILGIGRYIVGGLELPHNLIPKSSLEIKGIDELISRYYIRLTALNEAGVLAQMSRILGDLNIGIATVIQKESDMELKTAEVVITTYPALEKDIRQALRDIRELTVVKEIENALRIEDWEEDHN